MRSVAVADPAVLKSILVASDAEQQSPYHLSTLVLQRHQPPQGVWFLASRSKRRRHVLRHSVAAVARLGVHPSVISVTRVGGISCRENAVDDELRPIGLLWHLEVSLSDLHGPVLHGVLYSRVCFVVRVSFGGLWGFGASCDILDVTEHCSSFRRRHREVSHSNPVVIFCV